ncbi:MAG: class I SAM-dependent methyltransferase family protein [Candidatus Bathyarchaeia archaeon]
MFPNATNLVKDEIALRKSLKNALATVLSPSELAHLYSSYDIVGDIAIIRLTSQSKKHGEVIAETLMGIHKNVRTVLAQTGPVTGEFRLRALEHIAGEHKTSTFHKESGCVFHVDVQRCYFSPRLFYERMRIARQVKGGETVVNMFAGVGCFSIIIAKHSDVSKAYSIDINPVAVDYMKENIRLNRVYGKVVPMLGDAKEIIKEKLCHVADRVLMPLPERAFEYLSCALLALKENGGWIHYYDFEHASKNEDAAAKVKIKVANRLTDLGVNFEIPFGRVVRNTGPNWYQVVLDIKVKP